ncbi:hypothetical protein JCM8097_007111 [Rhodosporidiobolus ruineniae]
MKRSRSPSPPRQAPATASRAIQSTIALLSSHHLPSAVFRSLLDSLSDAHGAAVTQEDAHEKREGKRVKVERVHVAVQTDPVEEEQPAVEEEKEEDDPPVPPMPRWSLQAVQGELSELERMVMRDVEAALPLLDKLPPESNLKNGYANLPPPLRLPMQTTAFEDTDDPAQLEAYTVAKLDIEDLIEARRRHEWRVATGQAPSMTGE